MLAEPSLLAAFLAGLLSFISPCVLPLVPSYVSYVTGLSVGQLADPRERQGVRQAIIMNTLLFIAGFSGVFIAFGASASLLGQMLTDYQDLLRKVGGSLIVVLGLSLLGVIKLPVLMREGRFHVHARPAGYVGSVVIGAAFAAGWTPCVGPVLGTVLLYASTTETIVDGVTLLAYYSLGLGLPLFVTALAVDRFLVRYRQLQRHLGMVATVSALCLIVFGVLLFTDGVYVLTALLERYGIGSYVAQ